MKPDESIRQIDAQLRYYLHIRRPELLSDTEWAQRFQDLVWIRREEAKHNRQ